MKKGVLFLTVLAVAFLAWRMVSSDARLMPPDVRLPDNSTYTGELEGGFFHGQGTLHWADGAKYVGSFQNGLMHGQGELTEPNGVRYRGTFKEGLMHGQGKLKYGDGSSYVGEFAQNDLNGQGMMMDTNGNHYEGRFEHGMLVQGTAKDREGNVREGTFKNGLLEGQGTYASADGTVYKGEFVEGVLNGQGQIISQYGGRYEGQIVDWEYSGTGEYVDQEGNRYVGDFEYGMFHGEGVLTLAEPIDGVSEISGTWEYGSHPDDPRSSRRGRHRAKAVDELLYSQNALLQQQLDKLHANQADAIDLYFLGAALHDESVFYRELDFIDAFMAEQHGTFGKTVTLYNHTSKTGQKPLATEVALKQSLAGLEAKMNVDQDVLFVYLTSHGKPDELSVSFPGLTLANIEANRLASLLNESSIRWKVIMVSACYSGSFIDDLASDHHLIMTAAREDRVSFGCGEGSDMTYFAKAMFKESIHQHDSFEAAFEAAKVLIVQWEDEKQPGKDHSEPQISMGSLIAPHLKKWRAQNNKATQSP